MTERKRAQSSASTAEEVALSRTALTRPSRSHAISHTELLTSPIPDPSDPSSLVHAQSRIKSLTEVIKKQLQPEIEALRRENKELLGSAKHSAKHSFSDLGEDQSEELVKAMNHLEKRFVQSESILKKTIEDLKAQLDVERKAKMRLQRELEALVKDIDHGISHFHLRPQHETTVYQAQEAKEEATDAQLRSLQAQLSQQAAQHQATLRTSLSSLEQSLNASHAAELARVTEAWNVERGKSKVPVMGDARKLSAMLEELQRQNRFLLGIIEEQRTLIKSLGDMVEVSTTQQERLRTQDTHLANQEIYELKKTLCEVLQTRKDLELREGLERKNTELAARVAVSCR